jgi:alginate O-acetyltransferase complex protein AlgI
VAISVVANLGILAGFKYTVFVYDTGLALLQWGGYEVPDRTWRILLPLGISFHTFQGISYTVDVYRRKIAAVRSFWDYALFVTFFPQLAAGPIIRATEFLPQMRTPPRVSAAQVSDGLWLFVAGLFKKLFIADQLDLLIVSPVFAHPELVDAALIRWAILAWAVQIYCDFSGYTDIALGTGKFFGFELPPNFRLPYLATSITDFWRRWHLSLSTWLRDYLYFPLGGSQGSPLRTYCNLMLVFVLCGLWHGAEWRWFVYGVYNGILMGLHRAYDRSLAGKPWCDHLRASPIWVGVAWLATMTQLLLGLVLIRMESWANGWFMIQQALSFSPGRLSAEAIVSGVPVAVPLLMLLGLLGHLRGAAESLVDRFPLPMPAPGSIFHPAARPVPELLRGFVAATAVVLLVTLGPGVTQAFIYIQF